MPWLGFCGWRLASRGPLDAGRCSLHRAGQSFHKDLKRTPESLKLPSSHKFDANSAKKAIICPLAPKER